MDCKTARCNYPKTRDCDSPLRGYARGSAATHLLDMVDNLKQDLEKGHSPASGGKGVWRGGDVSEGWEILMVALGVTSTAIRAMIPHSSVMECRSLQTLNTGVRQKVIAGARAAMSERVGNVTTEGLA